jgi:hypothetical protein
MQRSPPALRNDASLKSKRESGMGNKPPVPERI